MLSAAAPASSAWSEQKGPADIHRPGLAHRFAATLAFADLEIVIDDACAILARTRQPLLGQGLADLGQVLMQRWRNVLHDGNAEPGQHACLIPGQCPGKLPAGPLGALAGM